ncbi:MAG: hypothetical protein NXI30_02530 [bacterium]|nr:hypothetical protein [bacterium]
MSQRQVWPELEDEVIRQAAERGLGIAAAVLGLGVASHSRSTSVERFHGCFMERYPHIVPLVGEYALSEREETIQETRKSWLAHCAGEPWLEADLRALGTSHAEHGVEPRTQPA